MNDLKITTEKFSSLIGHRPRACVVTFGCQMNARDSEKLRGVLEEAGFELTEEEVCDLVLYNTCTVRENANTRVYGRFGRLKNYKKKNPMMILGICGCMVQEEKAEEELKKKIPSLDFAFGTFNLDRFPEILNEVLNHKLERMSAPPLIEVSSSEEGHDTDSLPSKRSFSYKASVNIMYGCNNFCSYCIVPYVRGRERSRSPEDILSEIAKLKEEGVSEVMLLGQNVNSYGKTLADPVSFAELLDRIASESGLERIRFMTSHPKDLSDDLIRVMAAHENICKHLHLPMQHGSNRILKEMNRRYSREDYRELVRKVRAAMPDISLTTDLMVGFPGERDEDIDDMIEMVREAGFDNAFTFIYSKRTGTPAASMPDQIPEEISSKRFDRLLEVVHETAFKRCERFVGRRETVFVEGENSHKDGWLTGRLGHNLLVHFPGEKELIGQYIPVQITESKGFYLIGKRS